MAIRRDGVWHLSDGEYAALVADSKFLSNLLDAGVDNWEGYHYGYGSEDEEDE
ncbi:MAG TPA: hypothetical protein VIY48_15615 [Candidatus Paceibacterota bacterium]